MTKSEKRIAYERDYWQNHKQVKVTIPLAEWNALKARADLHEKTVGQLILAEAQSYQRGIYLPTLLIENRLKEISRLIRNIGGLLNQLAKHSNTFRQAVDDRQALQMLQRLERDIDLLVAKAWRQPPEQF